MHVSARTGVTAAAVGACCAVLATVVGMSRSLPEPSPPSVGGDVNPSPAPSASVETTRYPDPRPVPVNARLLPNLRSLPPEDVEIRMVDGNRQLWFTSIIANAGIGPAEVIPDELLPCPPRQQHASQVLYHNSAGDARFDRTVDKMRTTRHGGCMLDHHDHGHWHFDAMARFS